ncbi:MAG: flagellar protein FlaG [Pseudomonadota bacterium]
MPKLITTPSVRSSVVTPAGPSARVGTRQKLPGQMQDATPDEEEEIQAAELNQAVSAINDYVQNLRRDLHFTIDADTEECTVIKVIDSETQEVIRQIPPEEVLTLARSLEKAQGVIVRARA